jgi:predicted choloylglycine hydrolase
MIRLLDFLRSSKSQARHRNFHAVEAETNAELGRKLGSKFGGEIDGFVREIRNRRGWKRRLEAAQSLLDAARHHFPHHVEELEAYAQAAGQKLSDVWAMCLEDELDGLGQEHCTTMVTNGGALIAHNEDWDEASEDAICILQKSVGALTILELYYYAVPLGGCAFSINSHGYIQAINSLNHRDTAKGVPKCIVARHLSETSNPQQDIARLQGIPRSSGYAHTFVGMTGDITHVESTAKKLVVTQPAPPFVHTNHYVCPELEDFHVPVCEDESTFERLGEARRLVRAEMSPEAMMTAAGDQSNGEWNSLFNCETIGRAVVDLPSRRAKFWLRREARAGWIDYNLDLLPGTDAPVA